MNNRISSEASALELPHLRLILHFFQDLYCEVLRQKEKILSKAPVGDEGFSVFGTQHDLASETRVIPFVDQEAEEIIRVFQNLLEEQAIEVNYEGGSFAAACYKEAQYIMAALVDEIFLGLPWAGRRYWETHLLEERIFGTHVAGENFFNNLEHFLKERDPLKRELGLLYLTALGLGFRGKYRGFDDQGAISYYREQVFMFVYHKRPTLFDEQQLLFPACTLSTLEGGMEQETTDLRTWSLVFLGVLGTYLLLSFGIWYGATMPLQRAVNAILEDATNAS